ncbi:MAG: ABC transporter permease [Dehalococcoidia bacterium]|nr:ABC transporter permease [Dehalococcoidia bacterium]MDW8119106.1 ABC transporter permease [Chloroflexota bacterium]
MALGSSSPVGAVHTSTEVRALRRSPWKGVVRFIVRKPLGAVGAGMILFLVLFAYVGVFFMPYGKLEQNVLEALNAPSLRHPLGTDQFGRDMLTRIMYASQVSLFIGFATVLVSGVVGGIIGVVSGYLGGKVDLLFQRVVDVLMSFPLLILAMAIVAMLGASTYNVIIAIAISYAPRLARVVRSVALSVREKQYVEAARAIGCSDVRVMVYHVAPQCVAPTLVLVTAQLGAAILVESSLSFLGLGTQEPNPSLGNMLSGAAAGYFELAPWMAIFPGLAIALAVFGFNVFGDALRDVLDPRLRGAGR